MTTLCRVALLIDFVIDYLVIEIIDLYDFDLFRLVDRNRVFIVVIIYNDRHNIVDLIDRTRNRQLGAIRVLERGL